MKKIVSLLALLVTFLGTAQIVEPVKWSSSVVTISDTEIDLIITANIENNWHLYSQFTPDGGALPLVLTFKNQN
jgi:thiol:disulfide interchange protein DsbD